MYLYIYKDLYYLQFNGKTIVFETNNIGSIPIRYLKINNEYKNNNKNFLLKKTNK